MGISLAIIDRIEPTLHSISVCIKSVCPSSIRCENRNESDVLMNIFVAFSGAIDSNACQFATNFSASISVGEYSIDNASGPIITAHFTPFKLEISANISSLIIGGMQRKGIIVAMVLNSRGRTSTIPFCRDKIQ